MTSLYVIQLIPSQNLLMRRVGITRCTNIEKMLALYTPPSRKTGKAPALCSLKAQAEPRKRSIQSYGAGAAHNADTCTLCTFVASKSCQMLFHPFPVAVSPLAAG
jgi:hypothetical protein